MRIRTLALLAMTIAGLLIAAPIAVYAQSVPSLPNNFYGTLKIDGADAPAGTTVTANVTGAINGSFNPIVTTQAGKYGSVSTSVGGPWLLVQGEVVEGATIEFFINGRKAAQTAEFHSGLNTNLDLTVNTPAILPLAVNTELFSDIGTATATLNGNLAQTGEAASISLSFQWGTTQIYGFETTALTRSAPGAFSTTLNDLSPGTVYHFRAKAVAGQTTTYGVDSAFRTATPLIITIGVETNTASSITTTAAVLSGSLTQLNGVTSANLSFQWGTTLSYGSETARQTLNAPGTFSATLSGLAPNTLYHFRTKATSDQATTFGTDQTFATSALTLGGGGGGGSTGGGTVLTSTSTPTVSLSGLSGDVELKVDSSGKSQSGTILHDSAVRVTLSINSGTSLKSASGAPLAALTLTESSSIPPAPPLNIVIEVKEFGPSGATFDPPIILTLKYNEADLPPGARELEMVIAFWNGSQWVSLPTTVNADTNTLMTLVSHFTAFGILSNAGGSVPDSLPETPPLVVTTPATPSTPSAPQPSSPVQPSTSETAPQPSSPAQPPTSETAPQPSYPAQPSTSETAPTPASQEPVMGGPNWILIVGIMAGIIVLLVVTLLLRWKY